MELSGDHGKLIDSMTGRIRREYNRGNAVAADALCDFDAPTHYRGVAYQFAGATALLDLVKWADHSKDNLAKRLHDVRNDPDFLRLVSLFKEYKSPREAERFCDRLHAARRTPLRDFDDWSAMWRAMYADAIGKTQQWR